MAKPIRPVAPPLALRSNPATFSARAEGNITYQFEALPNWMDALGDFVDDRATSADADAIATAADRVQTGEDRVQTGEDRTAAEAAAAAAGASTGLDLSGRSGDYLRVNAGETALEFLSGANLSALAGVSTTGLLARTGAGTAAARTLTGTGNVIEVTNGNGVSGNPTINAVKATTAAAQAGTGVGLMDPVLTKAAIDALSTSLGLYNFQEFLTSGLWSKPDDALDDDAVYVQVVGAGGSGSRSNGSSTNRFTGGGGGGGIIFKYKMSELNATEGLIVGAGGSARTGNQNGQNGGGSAFRASGANLRIVCNGGQGGQVNNTTATGGTVTIRVDGLDIIANPTTNFGSDAVGSGDPIGAFEGAGCGYSARPNDGSFPAPGTASAKAGSGSAVESADGKFPGGGGAFSRTTSGAGGDGVVRVWCVRE